MVRYIKELVSFLPGIDTPTDLDEQILMVLKSQFKRENFFQLLFFGSIHLLSWISCFVAGYYLALELNTTGFFNYLSLIYSEFGFFDGYWFTWLMSLAESLPVVGLMFLVGALSVFLWSLINTINRSQKLILVRI